jgi:5-methylcytosine-specific restriction enzyme subunit McrC
MPRIRIVESEAAVVGLSADEAGALTALGQKLASKSSWWGEDEEAAPKSVIDVRQDSGGQWFVLVREAIGVISVGNHEIVVAPKIPDDHFLYLAHMGGLIPRIDASATTVEHGNNLWEVIAHWCLVATERVLRGELAKGYKESVEELELSRGRILPLDTARIFYEGRPNLACEFEEFSEDIALNRVLKGALDLMASSTLLEREVRHRARSALMRMDDVGRLRHSDLRVVPDRLTHRYRDAIGFAKVLLRGGGTKIAHGTAQGWCFLIRTPELVEAGVREVLRRLLAAKYDVRKKGKVLLPSRLTLNPDLVFGNNLAVGDVKYKLLGSEWSRADLYQSVAFAAGYEVRSAALVGFGGAVPLIAPIQLGQILVEPFIWDARLSSEPSQSGRRLAEDVLAFLTRASERRHQDLMAA